MTLQEFKEHLAEMAGEFRLAFSDKSGIRHKTKRTERHFSHACPIAACFGGENAGAFKTAVEAGLSKSDVAMITLAAYRPIERLSLSEDDSEALALREWMEKVLVGGEG